MINLKSLFSSVESELVELLSLNSLKCGGGAGASIVIQGHASASVLVSSLDKALFSLLIASFIKRHTPPTPVKACPDTATKDQDHMKTPQRMC